MKGFPGIFLAFPPLNMGMEVGNSPFLGILDSFPELLPNIGILMNREFRIAGMIQRTNQTETKLLRVLADGATKRAPCHQEQVI